MNQLITGLHHITALASDAKKNVDFYAGILSLRLVKKTVNYDAPDVYHLYYGNEKGEPGTILTFFPFPHIPKGTKGNGQLTVTSFSIPENALDYWMKRFDKFGVRYEAPKKRFDELVLYFEDHDGQGLELVANKEDNRIGFSYGNVPVEFAIKGFYGMTLSLENSKKTADILVGQMDHKLIAEKDNLFRYSASGKPGDFVDIMHKPNGERGIAGYGTVHHVAFATANEETQLLAREKLLNYGLHVTEVRNREYFRSIYFREPGGVLFEIATIPPGFTVDEPLSSLGESFKLPPWQEQNRAIFENELVPIKVETKRFAD